MFGVGFKLSRPPANYQCSRSKMQSRPCFALGSAYTYVRKWQEFFSSERCIGAVVCSLSRVYLSIMQLPEASFVLFLRLALGAELPIWLRVDCWSMWNNGIFMPNQNFPLRRTCLEWIQTRETTSKPPVHTKHQTAQTLICPMYSKGLIGKKAWVVPRIITHWGRVLSLSRVYFSRRQHQEASFVPWLRWSSGIDRPRLLRVDGQDMWKKGIFMPNNTSSLMRTYLE